MDPITRKEMYLARAGGQDVALPVPVTREEMYLHKIAIGGGSGGNADWNASEGEAGHVKNRTHYEDDYSIDGVIDVSAGEKISAEKIIQGIGYIHVNSSGRESGRLHDGAYYDLYINGEKIRSNASVQTTGTSIIDYNHIQIGVSFKSNRTTLLYDMTISMSAATTEDLHIQASYKYPGKVIPLDEKYIPNSIPKVQTATVGQTVVVKAVDENGKPTEWETADVGGSGGDMFVNVTYDENDELVADKTYVEIEEAIKSGVMPCCIYAGMRFILVASDSLSEIATYASSPVHRFSMLGVVGTGNSFVAAININDADYVEFNEYFLTLEAL